MNLTGTQRKKLLQAIISAYPTKANLEMMIDFELDTSLNAMAGVGSYQQVVYELIKWAQANEKLEILIGAASNDNPGNEDLKNIKQELFPSISDLTDTPGSSNFNQSSDSTATKGKSTEKLEPVTRKILILSANPRGTSKLRLDEEMREIKEGLRRAKKRDQYSIDTAEAVRYRDIHRAILDYEPHIIHFCGHGAGEEGLMFEDETGQVKLVDAEAIAGLFELFADQVECVVLNACYSKIQAEEIARHINYVVGMSKAIKDRVAIEFAVGFYDALGAGRPVEFAYKLGCNAIRMAGIAKHLTPVLIKKPDSELYCEVIDTYSKDRLVKIARQPARRTAVINYLTEELNNRLANPGSDPTERYWIYIALGKIGGNQAKSIVKGGLSDENPFARSGAKKAFDWLIKSQ